MWRELLIWVVCMALQLDGQDHDGWCGWCTGWSLWQSKPLRLPGGSWLQETWRGDRTRSPRRFHTPDIGRTPCLWGARCSSGNNGSHGNGPVLVGLLYASFGMGRFVSCLGGHTEICLIHHWIHTGDKPIICYQCRQCFADHQTLHTGISSISN